MTYLSKERQSSLENTTDEEKTELGVNDTNNDNETKSDVKNTPPEKEVKPISPPMTNGNNLVTESNVPKVELQNSIFVSIDAENQGQRELGGQQSPRNIHGWRFVCCMASILTTAFLFALGTMVVADIQPVIIVEFNDVPKLPWFGVAFTLGAAATTLFQAKIYVHFNAK
jgi:hypothetical protein